jgi:A/G-specific adenine glycosylase
LSQGLLAARVMAWQRSHGRHGLPWQGTRDPYRVWLSEVMLQQTQVSTVIEYYGRFLQRFPTVEALAAASLDDVLALWSGLGYYSRARNLHRCAQRVVLEHGGVFPGTSDALATLPGIGRSTAAAIAAFCFGERVAILDGNVKRVLSRVTAFEGDLARAPEVQRLWSAATELLPEHGMDVYTQGLMDLGATVCAARRPACGRCPLAGDCQAHALGTPERFPIKSHRRDRGERMNSWLWVQQRHEMLLTRRPAPGVWAGLWSLPEYPSITALDELTRHWPGRGQWLAPIRHALTHFEWTLHTLAWELPADSPVPPVLQALDPGCWVSADRARSMGLPAPLKKLLAPRVTAPSR